MGCFKLKGEESKQGAGKGLGLGSVAVDDEKVKALAGRVLTDGSYNVICLRGVFLQSTHNKSAHSFSGTFQVSRLPYSQFLVSSPFTETGILISPRKAGT